MSIIYICVRVRACVRMNERACRHRWTRGRFEGEGEGEGGTRTTCVRGGGDSLSFSFYSSFIIIQLDIVAAR